MIHNNSWISKKQKNYVHKPVYELIAERNIYKLGKISAKTIQDALYYRKWNEWDWHWRLPQQMLFRKWILDTVARIVTKLGHVGERWDIKWYDWWVKQSNLMSHDFPGTHLAVAKFLELVQEKDIFKDTDLCRTKSMHISNSILHKLPNERLVLAGIWFKALCNDHLRWKIILDLSDKELLSGFEVMLLPYHFPEDKVTDENIRLFITLCKKLLENNVDRKKRPTNNQIESLLIEWMSNWDNLIYAQNIIKNQL